ncbi:S41 family peptidase [Candidatus Collierbacteria bacterium]|nr:S41 family peptidase [Candidatus Collierbacteria bacterium]
MTFLGKIRLGAIVLLLVIFTAVVSYRLGKKDGLAVTIIGSDGQKADLTLFWDVWSKLEKNYLDKKVLDPKKMMYGAISGMTAALDDPYTSFFPPTENKRSKEDLSGEFSGVGIQLGFVDKTLAVMAPLPGNPAERAGIKAGDLILHIKDEANNIDKDTNGINLIDAVNYIRGKKGTTVILTIYHDKDAKPKEISLVRDTINVPSVEISWVGKDGKIAQIKVNRFGDKTLEEWDKAVSEFLTKKGTGVILDLRNNPGGYLQRAIDLGSEFIADGTIVQQQGVDKTENFGVDRPGRLIGVPLVVMVNKGSASAAEILSGALKERLGVKLVGEKTFGKGTVQEVEDLPGGAGIHITIAKWNLPSGKNIHKEGIEPDVVVEYLPNDKDPKADNQLDKAIETLDGVMTAGK